MVTVIDVLPKSVAYKAGIKKGDKIISINGTAFYDILDIIYAESEEKLEIIIENIQYPIKITKKAYEPLGLIFNESIEINPKRCSNKCLFCFIDQLPKGMRETLYVKDDDYRLSFCTGSYVTLTNLTDNDIKRIIKYKLSPLYISVHAYDNDVRRRLVNNRNTDRMFDIIKLLKDNGIVMHAQIVLCPDINDGKILEETLTELLKFYPSISTVAVVPVGLTKHREALYPLKPMDAESAKAAILITESIDKKARNTSVRGFAWCSDEMYLKAGLELPAYDYYGDFMQIENGVGMIRDFEAELTYINRGVSGEFHLITGESFYPILCNIARKLSENTGSTLKVHKIVNNYFGESVTVAGLITSVDIITQLKGKVEGKHLILPSVMLREFTDIFLDGMTVEEVEKELKAKISIASDGKSLEDIISGV